MSLVAIPKLLTKLDPEYLAELIKDASSACEGGQRNASVYMTFKSSQSCWFYRTPAPSCHPQLTTAYFPHIFTNPSSLMLKRLKIPQVSQYG